LTTHWSDEAEKSRSSWMAGSATFTTVPSRTTMNWAMQTITSTSHRRSADGAEGGADVTGRLLRTNGTKAE
jgi:hypothetical protein